jgi:hypothetical protein
MAARELQQTKRPLSSRAIAVQIIVGVAEGRQRTAAVLRSSLGRAVTIPYRASEKRARSHRSILKGQWHAKPGAVQDDGHGFLRLSEQGVLKDFAPDLPLAEARTLAVTQGPLAASTFNDKVTTAAWKSKPSWFVVSANDRVVNPQMERDRAALMHAKTTVLRSRRASLLSHPVEVPTSSKTRCARWRRSRNKMISRARIARWRSAPCDILRHKASADRVSAEPNPPSAVTG